jgi:decaprenyl-phosphate phosphoribosyltransferase
MALFYTKAVLFESCIARPSRIDRQRVSIRGNHAACLMPTTLTPAFDATAVLRLLRPHQWVKNGFVFAGIIFGQGLHDGPLLSRVLLAFLAFCVFSSAAYIANDWRDRESDALHPEKKHRPLAAGSVSPRVAALLGGALILAGLALAWGQPVLIALLLLYAGLNFAYSWRLKQVPVVDVTLIASGFMLRLLAGTVAVGIPPSRWLLLTGIFMALFLGFAKRRAESFHREASQRAVLLRYPPALLDTFIALTLAATLTTYSLFATSPEAVAAHGELLVYTVPVVIFAMLRYAWQVHQGLGEDVARDLLRDPWIVASGVIWVAIFTSRWL